MSYGVWGEAQGAERRAPAFAASFTSFRWPKKASAGRAGGIANAAQQRAL